MPKINEKKVPPIVMELYKRRICLYNEMQKCEAYISSWAKRNGIEYTVAIAMCNEQLLDSMCDDYSENEVNVV